jgi:alcohol dehydrogenase (cytochrome c)
MANEGIDSTLKQRAERPRQSMDSPSKASLKNKSRSRIWTIVGTLVVLGMFAGGGLYLAYPVLMGTIAGLCRSYLLSLNAPAGVVVTEQNPAYRGTLSVVAASAHSSAGGEDWPSYNRTLSSDRYSPLREIDTKNAGRLKVLCTYDLGGFSAFESGLLMVEGALIGTTVYDIFSLNPATCALNWRTHEDYTPTLLPANRGAAYLDGMLFRGTQDGRVLAYDFKTGKRLWETRISDPKLGEAVTAAPIAWDGKVFIGNAGGDFKGGKGHMFALDAKTGKVLWEFYLTPRVESDFALGPVGASPLDGTTWKIPSGIPISGAGSWTSYTLDTNTGALYIPGGNPAPDFVVGVREGGDLFSDSIVVLDAQTGNYRHHFQVVPRDWHDWDASNPPVPIQTMGGKQLLAVAPKNGYLFGFDLANNQLLYRVPVTRMENVDVPFSGKPVHFCPGAVGGDEWNSPSFVPETNLILVAEVEWCATVKARGEKKLKDQPMGSPWSGMATLNPFWLFGRADRDNNWAGWIYAVDADNGVWKWRLKSNYPIVGGMTPTAGGVVFVGDVGGNFYALDAANGQKLWSQQLDGGVGGGVITYAANGAQKVAVAYGFSNLQWPVKVATAKIEVLGLEDDAAAHRNPRIARDN